MKAFAVFGDPIAHTLSPRIHNNAIAALNLRGFYARFHLQTPQTLREKIFELGLSGANITVPFKEKALEIADEADKMAANIGSANTLLVKGRQIHAFNTDGIGFLQAIAEFKGIRTALILGAGGTAKALAFVLGLCGIKVSVANRSAGRLRDFTSCECFLYSDLSEILGLNLGENSSENLCDNSLNLSKNLRENLSENSRENSLNLRENLHENSFKNLSVNSNENFINSRENSLNLNENSNKNSRENPQNLSANSSQISNLNSKNSLNLNQNFKSTKSAQKAENPRFDLIINSTSAGLRDKNLPCDETLLKTLLSRAKFAFEVIYGHETPFFKLAKSILPQECVKDGRDMLLWQGVFAFELFWGFVPSFELLLKSLNLPNLINENSQPNLALNSQNLSDKNSKLNLSNLASNLQNSLNFGDKNSKQNLQNLPNLNNENLQPNSQNLSNEISSEIQSKFSSQTSQNQIPNTRNLKQNSALNSQNLSNKNSQLNSPNLTSDLENPNEISKILQTRKIIAKAMNEALEL